MNFNMTAVYATSGLGMVLTFMLVVSNFWRLRQRSKENDALMMLIVCSFIACLVDSLAFMSDGRPGLLHFLLNFGGNTYLFGCNMLVGTQWIYFLSAHLHAPLGQWNQRLIRGLNLVGFSVLVVNLFVPVAFRVDENNVYTRCPLFWVYMVIEFFYMLDSLVMYLKVRRESGHMKFFPVWLFLLPVMLGIATQAMFYGIAVIWPAFAVSMAGVMASLQNELIFQDKLTGLYNRFYLDGIRDRLKRSGHTKLLAMMLDVNDFKSINDRYGHTMGDKALIDTGTLLTQSVGGRGTVVRYAGDEFIVLMPDDGRMDEEQIIDRINRDTEEFNKNAGKPYALSFAIGCIRLDLEQETIETLLNEVDRRMYANKPRKKEAR